MQAVALDISEAMTIPSLEEAKQYIYSIDFSMIIDKMVNHQGWKRKHAEKVCEMYRNYLYLCKKYGDKYQLPPSEEIDQFFHEHILNTAQYRSKDCLAIFGRYYDHYPYFGIDDKTNMQDLNNTFNITKQLYEKEFGEKLEAVRSNIEILKSYLKRFWLEMSQNGAN